jgi:hypothetical protein
MSPLVRYGNSNGISNSESLYLRNLNVRPAGRVTYNLTPKINQHGQSHPTGIQNTLSTTPPKLTSRNIRDPSPSTTGREEKTKPKLNFEKHTHQTEFHPPTTSTASHSLSENYSQGVQVHMFFAVKSAKMGQFKTPAR